MIGLSTLLSNLSHKSGAWQTAIPATWMQGRTAYGGLSSALAHHCARDMLGADAPPLRSAQVAFIGPLAQQATIRCELLRRGRNTNFVEVRIEGDDGLALQGVFIFMSGRNSTVHFRNTATPYAGTPPADGAIRSGPERFFTCNFEYSDKRHQGNAITNTLGDWYRLKDRAGLDPITELLALGDALPPAAFGLLRETGPISSMNWHMNLLDEKPTTDNGWWLLQSTTHHAEHGASSQHMTIWNSRLEPVMASMQSVALYI